MRTLTFNADLPKIAATMILSKFSKKAYNSKFSPVVLENIERQPLPKEDWIRVKNIQTGICGTDMTFYTCKQSSSIAMYPVPGNSKVYMGHETVGEVTEIGDNVTDLKVGDRVIMRKYMQCCALKGYREDDWCDNCKKGEYSICSNYGKDPLVNVTTGAGMGDEYIGPRSQVIKIDKNVTNDQAILIEPAAVSIHSVMKKIPEKGDKVLVIGAGMIGLNIVQFIKVLQPDCTVYVIERSKKKQKLALKLGADKIVEGDAYNYFEKETNAKLYKKGDNKMLIGGLDIIYDSVGKDYIFNTAIRLLRARGTYVKVGFQMTPTKFDETPIWWQEINIIGVDSYGMEEYKGNTIQSFDLVLKLLKEKKITLDDFITSRYKLSNYKKAFYKMLTNGDKEIKIVLEID